ncbi:TIGR03016 family PEP-CTERM system-associated outer membrane protein [Pseudorhodoferax sp.]|uniref:TIGR03016 family PEP-CTERM system-associated outer membrane protein n=1 Tax=Pseudorhodoferax sp. TaxID=1993553 RepID=UPI0039E4090D
MSFVPRVNVEGTWTSNVRPQAGGVGASGSDFVMSVQPGFRFTADGDRLKAYADYSFRRLFYASHSSLNRNQNSLNAFGSYELAENFAFIDFNGRMSQDTISAFGSLADDGVSINNNRTETRMYRVSPYVRGWFGDWANYQARYARTMYRAKSVGTADYDLDEYSLLLNSGSQLRAFSWTLDTSRQTQDYIVGRGYESSRIRLFLTYLFTPQLSVSLIPGWESNNYASQENDKQSDVTMGGRVQWAISNRTNVSALLEKRVFGNAHAISFEHRTPRTAWRFSDTRDASATPGQNTSFSMGPLYDLLFYQFASVEPDPVLRAQLVESYLAQTGEDGSRNVDLSLLTSAMTLNRRQNLSFTLLGLRDSLTFMASRQETSRLLQIGAGGDLGSSNFVRQHGFSVAYSRRLTPLTSFNVVASQSRSSGENTRMQRSELRSLDVGLSTRLSKDTTATVGVRRILSDTAAASSYTESSVRGGLSMRF